MALATQKEGVLPLHMVQKPPFMVQDTNAPEIEGESRPYRHFKAQNGLITRPSPDIATVYDLFTTTAKRYGDKAAIGSRSLVKTHVEKKKVSKVVDGVTSEVEKKWTYFELSPYKFLTYKEYEARALNVGAGLRKLGLEPGDRIHIFASTSANWLSLSHGCSSQSITIATAYDTLGPDAVEYSLTQTEAKAMYTDPHLFKTASRPLKNAKEVKYLIYNDSTNMPISDEELAEFKASHPELTILSFSDLVALGAEHPVPAVPPKATDLCCIMYTSGSSGTPKGVPITHEGLVAGITGLYEVIAETISSKEVVLAYLPLAHILEMAVENLVIFIGGTLGYGSPRTLADTSMRNCAGDMRELAPTVMIGVPQIWETIRKGIEGRVNSGNMLTRNLFWGAYNLKSLLVSSGLPGGYILDALVFNKVRLLTGGRVRFLFNGGSGISEGTLQFMSMVLAPMVTGYGLTETCANGSLGCPLQWTSNAIGPVPPSIELKLVSLPDLGYSTSSNPPQGEILLRGAAVAKEYFKNPEETEKAYTPDGWFRTGDIGEVDSFGHVKIVDRVKNLVKLQGGEYIALEKLEAIYRGSKYVNNLMIHGDSSQPRPIAIITPNEKPLAELAQSLSVDHGNMHHDKKVQEAVHKDLIAVAKKAGLNSLEMVSGVVIVEEEWTPASGLVTATQKVNRRGLRDHYKSEIMKCMKAQSS
ncbi:acetyl-CoA synthetase-like protein [Xylaria bambusicola]|uniref:acetyl-CoA synthetase-like protein n=1 Tax=Xylaria bambusicola TaxID=326684 RepID=UPI002007DDF4|nr:acetyl-CoA synthetase-like protein [Xylaria bambusicola]KAI0514917.1 acetyl-CoA synthetase-like protein [Xylaria bambusicola]